MVEESKREGEEGGEHGEITYNTKVNLPNRRSFTSRWERISRKQLPINIKVARNRAIGPRRNNRRIYFNLARPALEKIRRKRKRRVNQLYPDNSSQIGSGLGSELLKTGINLGSRALGSDIGKKIINKGIDNIPNIFKFVRFKVKNKRIKTALESEIADLVVSDAQKKVRQKYNPNDLI